MAPRRERAKQICSIRLNTVQKVNAILLAGGSAFGLDAASGVMRYLEENKMGYRVGPVIVPIVPAAILFDLGLGDPRIRPDEQSGYAACQAAANSCAEEGNVGAGAGATVGKMFGMQAAMKSGIGSASITVGDSGLVVGAIVAVNALGDVSTSRNGPHSGGRARRRRRISGLHRADYAKAQRSPAIIQPNPVRTPPSALWPPTRR